MKLKDAILHKPTVEAKPRLKQAEFIHPDSFSNMWTANSQGRPHRNKEFINELMEVWQENIGSEHELIVTDTLVDMKHMKYVDATNKLIVSLSHKELEEKLDEGCEVEELAPSRALVKIQAQGFEGKMAPTIVLEITEKGETLAFGENVSICGNLTILGAEKERVVKLSYKSERRHWTKTEAGQRFIQILGGTKSKFEVDQRTVKWMEKQVISEDRFHSFLGKQMAKVEFANIRRNMRRLGSLSSAQKTISLNSKQLAMIAVESEEVKMQANSPYAWNEDGTASLWSVYNWGTDVLKFLRPGTASGREIQSIVNWGKLLEGYFVKN